MNDRPTGYCVGCGQRETHQRTCPLIKQALRMLGNEALVIKQPGPLSMTGNVWYVLEGESTALCIDEIPTGCHDYYVWHEMVDLAGSLYYTEDTDGLTLSYMEFWDIPEDAGL